MPTATTARRRGPKRPIEPTADLVMYDRKSVAAIIGMHTRTLDRMISSGEFPRRDLAIRNSPRWRDATVRRWVAEKLAQQGRS